MGQCLPEYLEHRADLVDISAHDDAPTQLFKQHARRLLLESLQEALPEQDVDALLEFFATDEGKEYLSKREQLGVLQEPDIQEALGDVLGKTLQAHDPAALAELQQVMAQMVLEAAPEDEAEREAFLEELAGTVKDRLRQESAAV